MKPSSPRRAVLAGLGAAVALGSVPVAAQDAPAAPAPELVAVADGVWTARVPDGPRLLVIPQRSVPMVSCTVLVPAGSVFETPATNGAAHYLEHLLFNGTRGRTREEIYATGDLLGAYNNASTQRERAIFQLLLPSENWRAGLDLQADMLLASTLPADMFAKERGIILEELAKDRTDPGYEAERFHDRVLWGDDPRSLPVLGTEESIAAMDPEAVAAYYRAHYRPAGMTIVLMGDLDPVEGAAEIARLYGGRPGAPPPLPPRPGFPEGRTVRAQTVTGLHKIQVRVNLPLPALGADDLAAARVLASILGSGEHSALGRAIEAAGITPLAAWASVDAGTPGSVLTLGADLPEDARGGEVDDGDAPAVGNLLAHLARFAEIGPAPVELESARRAFAAEEIGLMEKMHYWGMMRADVLGSDRPENAVRLVDALHGDLGARVRSLARAALADGRIAVTVAGHGVSDAYEPFDAPPPASSATWLKPAGGAPVERSPLDPPADLVTTPGIRRLVLDDGTVLVVQASRDSRTFATHVLLRDRAAVEDAVAVPRGASDVVHRAMGVATDSLDEDALRGRLAALGATLKTTDSDWIPYDDYYFSPEFSYLRLETIDTFGLDALALLGDVLRHPRLDEGQVAKAKAQAVQRAQRDAGSPRPRAEQAFFAALSPDHPLAQPVLGSAEALETLDVDGARRLHAAMTGPGRVVVVVCTNLDPDRVVAVVREAFARPAGADADVVVTPPSAAPGNAPWPRAVEIETGKEQSWIEVGFPLDVAADERPAVALAASVLSERLSERLREQEGLAYSVGASVRLDGPGPCLAMGAGTRPENLERMRDGMEAVLADLVAYPPSVEELEGARNRGEGRQRMRRLSRIGQAFALSMLELRGRDVEHPDADVPALRAVTPEDVARVAAARFDTGREVVAIAR